MNPTWIAVEGLDGCGKSTQVQLLATQLQALAVREPGGTPTGQAIRNLVLHSDIDPAARTEVLLFAADRAQLYSEVIAPALANGRHVVSDRSVWSSVAYQGYARNVGPDAIIRINDWALDGRWPDQVVYLHGNPARLRQRLHTDLDRVERSADEFFERAADGFLDLARRHGWIVVDAEQDRDTVARDIVAALAERDIMTRSTL